MKNLKFILLLVIAISAFSCKKGSNDPFISLMSRKARLTGEWSLKGGSVTTTSTSGNSTVTYTSSTATNVDVTGTSVRSYSELITFKKDGWFTIVVTDTYAGSIPFTVTTNGYWYFGSKNKNLDIRNRQQVVLITTKVTTLSAGNTSSVDYTGAACPIKTFLMDELKNKELTTIEDASDKASSTETIVGTKVYEKK